VDIERVTVLLNQPVIRKLLWQQVGFSNIRPAFTTTVYAFLNPKLPSAAWDFFCLRFGFSHSSTIRFDGARFAIAPTRIGIFSTTTDWPIFNFL